MTALAFYLSFVCSSTIMLNTSREPWEKYDYDMLDQAKENCVKHYLDAPCVKLFKKFDRKQYSVVCGLESK